ncbi:MAG: hypothetical protein IT174_05640 [Acidobacteria bacterium]|nr:hypothetical protein [Acidobacteriota bacterium]
MAIANVKPKPYYTIEQYLAWERQAEERSEFIDGEIKLTWPFKSEYSLR